MPGLPEEPASPMNTQSGWLARNSNRALVLLGFALALFLLTFADAARLDSARAREQAVRAGLAARLGLTDLSLFTEARYTRHLSQADLHSAFQDHPAAFEHFPSGSLEPPPRTPTSPHANLDRKTKVSD